MFKSTADRFRDGLILASRCLIVLLFLIFGWKKLTDFNGTIGYMAATGAPFPPVSAAIAVLMEFFVSIALVLGAWTRPLALLLMVYTLGTSIIGHHYWTLSGAGRFESMINFYKNLSIMGGLLMLFVTGAGRYSVTADRA